MSEYKKIYTSSELLNCSRFLFKSGNEFQYQSFNKTIRRTLFTKKKKVVVLKKSFDEKSLNDRY